jgi:hypothetical protein
VRYYLGWNRVATKIDSISSEIEKLGMKNKTNDFWKREKVRDKNDST